MGTPFPQTMLDMSKHKEVGWLEIKRVRWVYGEPQSVFYIQSLTFSSCVGSHIVWLKYEFSPIDLRAERKYGREKIIMAVLGIKVLPFGNKSNT
jgi:hypothetical protein